MLSRIRKIQYSHKQQSLGMVEAPGGGLFRYLLAVYTRAARARLRMGYFGACNQISRRQVSFLVEA